MNDSVLTAYTNFGGYNFGSVFAVFIALIAIWMMFVMGSSFYEYGTGRTKEFPVAMTIIRVGVVLSIAAIVTSWLRA